MFFVERPTPETCPIVHDNTIITSDNINLSGTRTMRLISSCNAKNNVQIITKVENSALAKFSDYQSSILMIMILNTHSNGVALLAVTKLSQI